MNRRTEDLSAVRPALAESSPVSLADATMGLGSIALASLLEPRRPARRRAAHLIDPARPFAPRPPHFPARAKNVLVIFCAGAVSQLETWDLQARSDQARRPALAGRSRRHLPGAGGESRPPAVRLPAARADRQDGLRHAPASGRTHRRHRLHPLADQQEQHARPRRELPVHRLRPRWLPQPGLLGQLRAGQREPESARLRRDPRPARRAAERLEQLGPRLPARRLPGHAASAPRTRSATWPRPESALDSDQAAARAFATDEPAPPRRSLRRRQARRPDRQLRTGRANAAQHPTDQRPFHRARAHPQALRRRRLLESRSRRRSRATASWPGA